MLFKKFKDKMTGFFEVLMAACQCEVLVLLKKEAKVKY